MTVEHDLDSAEFFDILTNTLRNATPLWTDAAQALIDSADDSMYLVDGQCRYFFVNRAHLERLGRSLRDVIGKNYADFHSKSESDEFKKKIAGVLETGKSVLQEHTSALDGRTFLRTYTPLKKRSGQNPYGILVISKDVTDYHRERKQAEELLGRYRILTDLAKDIILFIRLRDGLILDANRSAISAYGYSKEALLSLTIFQLHHSASSDLINGQMDEADSSGILFEAVHRRKDGSIFPVEVSSRGTTLGGEKVLLSIIRDISRRKQLEAEREESEAKYRALFEHSGDGIFLITGDRIRDCNLRALELFGCSGKEEILGRHPYELSPEFQADGRDSDQRAAEVINTALPDDSGFFEWRHVRKDGTPFDAEVKFNKIEYRGQELFQTIVRDITKRRETERALRENRDYLQRLTDTLGDGVFTLKYPERTIEYVNKAALMIFGYSQEEIIGMKALHFYADESYFLKSSEILSEAINNGNEVVRFETISKRKNGEIFPSEITVTFMRDADIPVKTITIVKDISDRKNAESAMKESEMRYNALAENAQIGIYISQNSRFKYVNSYVVWGTGYSYEELIDNDVFLFVHPDDKEAAKKGALKMLKEDQVAREETIMPFGFRVILKSGEVRSLVSTVAPIQYHGERAIIGTTMDITNLKQMEKELLSARNQLIQSEKLAAVGKLSAGVAHEILNPTHIMSMRIQLMEMTETLSEKAREALAICKSQIQRITRITHDLSQFSRVDAIQSLQMENIKDVLEQVLNLMAPRFRIESVEIERNYETPDTLQACINLPRIEQVIFNILNNAIDAMTSKKEKRITLSTMQTTSNDGVFARIKISDLGTGVKEEDLLRIFDPFFTSKEPGKGVGLGLSICYGIIQDHGGKIWAENNSTGGSSFFIDLPLNQTCQKRTN